MALALALGIVATTLGIVDLIRVRNDIHATRGQVRSLGEMVTNTTEQLDTVVTIVGNATRDIAVQMKLNDLMMQNMLMLT